MTDQYQITAEQLLAFIERYETLEAEKKQIAEAQKEVMLEAKFCGYDTAIMREIIKLRKMDPGERAEKEAILQVYLDALGLG
jgi:uncharacterized protein (UPF0335 family)